MSEDLPSNFDSLSASEKKLVNEVCEQFESDLHTSRLLKISDYTSNLPDQLRPIAFAEMVQLECHYRKQFEVQELNISARRIGPYLLIEELGHGGFGVVYRAEDTRDGRICAVKVYRPASHSDPDSLKRLHREAELAARLNHPNIVRIYEFGVDGPLFFLAVDFINGPSLAKWLTECKQRGEAITIKESVELVATISEAVQHAHDRGVLHRDVKPGNIILWKNDFSKNRPTSQQTTKESESFYPKSNWVPMLTDFGFARTVENDTDTTKSGLLAGSPAYMAPEQATGRQKEVSARTDIYALGVILYELLTGRLPFTASSTVELLIQIVNSHPEDIRLRYSNVPANLAAICHKCLEKNPNQRFKSANELSQELRRFLNGERTTTQPPGAMKRGIQWIFNHPRISITGISITVLFVVVFSAIFINSVLIKNVNNDLKISLAERDTINGQLRKIAYADAIRRINSLSNYGEIEAAKIELNNWIPNPREEDLRGWEWHYLKNQIDFGEITRWQIGTVYCLAFSPDGQALAASGTEGRVFVRDPETGRDLIQPILHPTEINEIVWTPDGRKLATVGNDGVVRIWNRDGTKVADLEGHHGKISSLAISPDGQWLATAGKDGTVRIWNTNGIDLPSRLCASQAQNAQAVGFSPDGQSLIIGWEDTQVDRFNVSTGKITSFGKNSCALVAIRSCQQTKSVFAAGRREIFALDQMKEKYDVFSSPDRQDGRINDAVLNASGTLLAVAHEGLLKILNTQNGKVLTTIRGHESRIWSVAFHPHKPVLVSSGADGTVRFWNVQELLRTQQKIVVANVGSRIALFPKFEAIVLLRSDPPVAEVWKFGDFEPVCLAKKTLNGEGIPITLPSENSILFRDINNHIQRLDLAERIESGREKHITKYELFSSEYAVMKSNQVLLKADQNFYEKYILAISPKNNLLVVPDGLNLHLLSTIDKKITSIIESPLRYSASVAFNKESTVLAQGGKENVILWNLHTNEVIKKLAIKGSTRKIEFSPTGDILAIGGMDGVVHLWDTVENRHSHLIGHTDGVDALCFSKDGRTLVSGSDDGSIQFWQTETGRELLKINGPGGSILFLKFSHDERYLYCAALDDSDLNQQVTIVRYDRGK